MESGERHTPEKIEEIRKLVIGMLKTVYDPEIPVDIYELGLVYGIDISPTGKVDIRMTLTSPGCPVAEILPKEVELKVASIEGVSGVDLELVWDPPWTSERMSEAARLELNL